MKSNEINVTEIMKELKLQAKAKKTECKILEFDEMGAILNKESLQYVEPYDREEFIRELTEVNTRFWINPDIGLENLGGFKGKIKKIVKKLINFNIRPLVDKQNEYNMVSVRAFNQIRNYMLTHDNIDKRVEDLQYVLEKEVLKPMELYSFHYMEMKKAYQESLDTIKIYTKKVAELEKKIELLEGLVKTGK